jgi:HK97 family phage prohead protease
MMEYEYRNRSNGVEVEDISTDGRTIEGWALRWEKPYRVTDNGRDFYEESWRYRCTSRSIANRRNMFELQVDHGNDRVGLTEFFERNEGLWFKAEIEPDREEIIAEVKRGSKRGVSVRYAPVHVEKIRDNPNDVMIEIVEARLRELSITDDPQYREDSRVEVMRAKDLRTKQNELMATVRDELALYERLRMN